MEYSNKISVIVLMHNQIPMTMRCLTALSDAVAGLDHEVILLDNGSTQDTIPLNKCDRLFHRFQMPRSEENVSFSAGNNRCVREASGRWLLFLNNDVFLHRESVRRLLVPLLEKEGTGITGGKLLFPGGTAVQHAGIGQMLWAHPSNYGVGAYSEDPRLQRRRECFAMTGAMLSVDREIFEKVGGFDERYIWGTEDIDLCLKVRAAGWKATYCPDAVAIHHGSATLKGSKRCEHENNCRLYRQLWGSVLVPAEQNYIRFLKSQLIRRVAVFGMGTAACSLAGILSENAIEIVAFTSSDVKSTGETFLDRPVIPLALLSSAHYDRLIIASQYYFAVEPVIRALDPLNEPIYPLLN
jgi:GT2 family glycosyltransferase